MMILLNLITKIKLKTNFQFILDLLGILLMRKNESIFLNKISKLPNLEYILIETRSDKDDLFGVGKKISKNEFITDHYRRFINKIVLVNKIKRNFKIIYLKESKKGFSKFKKEDPCLIRLIAIKK